MTREHELGQPRDRQESEVEAGERGEGVGGSGTHPGEEGGVEVEEVVLTLHHHHHRTHRGHQGQRQGKT